jgi:hypothetical protein
VQLPYEQRIKYADWPEEEDCIEMQFRLIYQGKLPSGGAETQRKWKHEIRRTIHQQLLELWTVHPFLKRFTEGRVPKNFPDMSETVSVMHDMAEKFPKYGSFRFLPLIRNSSGVACALDILFLRRDEPGQLVRSGGDIDNRIKVLFDALRMPQETPEIRGFDPQAGEDPFLCLLQDDRLITEFNVTTDRLLTPVGSGSETDVHLVIRVKTLVTTNKGADTWDLFSYDK